MAANKDSALKALNPNETTSQKLAAPLTALSSEADPYPHYLAAGVCAGGAGWAYSRMNNPRAAAIAGGFAALYFTAGRLLVMGHDKLGYDVGTVTSLGLVATTLPRAWATGEPYVSTLATVGGMSSIANVLKSFQLRTGKPKDMEIRH